MRSQIIVWSKTEPKACTDKEIRVRRLSSSRQPLRSRGYGCGGGATARNWVLEWLARALVPRGKRQGEGESSALPDLAFNN